MCPLAALASIDGDAMTQLKHEGNTVDAGPGGVVRWRTGGKGGRKRVLKKQDPGSDGEEVMSHAGLHVRTVCSGFGSEKYNPLKTKSKYAQVKLNGAEGGGGNADVDCNQACRAGFNSPSITLSSLLAATWPS